jgi:phospholipase D1/2
LKQKSSEGVKVLILLWNEKLSTERHINGLMRTHDVETQEFFSGTNVECVLVQRAKYDSLLSYEFVSTNYAHHQKTIVLDSPVDDYSSSKVHKLTNVRSAV